MYERGTSEDWRTFAELASKEEDPVKLMELADKLHRALDQQLPSRGAQSEPAPPDAYASQ